MNQNCDISSNPIISFPDTMKARFSIINVERRRKIELDLSDPHSNKNGLPCCVDTEGNQNTWSNSRPYDLKDNIFCINIDKNGGIQVDQSIFEYTMKELTKNKFPNYIDTQGDQRYSPQFSSIYHER